MNSKNAFMRIKISHNYEKEINGCNDKLLN